MSGHHDLDLANIDFEEQLLEELLEHFETGDRGSSAYGFHKVAYVTFC